MSYRRSISDRSLLLSKIQDEEFDSLEKITETSETSVLLADVKVTFKKLRSCIENGDIEEVKNLLTIPSVHVQIIDISTKTSVLHIAAKFGNVQMLNTLLSYDFIKKKINWQDKKGTTPLMAAAWFENLSAFHILLENGADTNKISLISLKTVLHYASIVDSEMCEVILERNSEESFINKQDLNGCTALMLAVIAGTKSTHTLLAFGADYMITNTIGRNLLHMAVAYHRYDTITKLITHIDQVEFLDQTDINDDSPLMLAIRTGDMFSIDCILESPLSNVLVQRCRPIMNLLVGNCNTLEKIMSHVRNPLFFNYTDLQGKTLMMYAAERNYMEMVKLLLANNISFKERNSLTGETLLHIAAYTSNDVLLDLLLQTKGIEEIINTVDRRGATAYDVLLAKANFLCWLRFYKSGFISNNYVNKDNESSLFIAIKEGNYDLMLCILLSEKFIDLHENASITMVDDIISREMKCEIYPSDVFIILGVLAEDKGWASAPFQEYLFETNNKGENIFHACVIGNNMDCTRFIHTYVTRFTKHVEDIDKPDIYGVTPLMLALKCCSPEMVKFFIKSKADFGRKNASGLSGLEIIFDGIHEYRDILFEIVKECAIVDSKLRPRGTSYGLLTLNYDILCPAKYPQMYFFEHLFRLLRGPNSLDILSHPVIEFFVLNKWNRIEDLVGRRYLLRINTIVIFSAYLTYSLCNFLNVNSPQYSILWWLTLTTSFLACLVNLPLFIIFYLEKKIHFAVIFSFPILIIIFLQMDLRRRLTLEVGAVAALFSWLSIFVHGFQSRIGFQIAMFSQVLKTIISYLPICCLIIIGFSSCFFTLFHDYIQFNNPLHSFLHTSILILQGQIDIPMFSEDIIPVNSSFTMFNPVDEDHETINGFLDSRNMLIEGSVVLLFQVLVTICIMNMLLALAVKSSEAMELEGQIYRIRTYIEVIAGWELLVETKFYKYLSKLHLEIFVGLPRNFKEVIEAPTLMYPLHVPKFYGLDLFKLKDGAVDVEHLKSKKMKYLKDIIVSKQGSSYSLSRIRAIHSLNSTRLIWV